MSRFNTSKIHALLTDDEVLTLKQMAEYSKPTPGHSHTAEGERELKLLEKLVAAVEEYR